MIRILLVDDHALFREGVARLLSPEPDFKVVGCCASVEEGLRALRSSPVDIVLLDFDLGREQGGDFLTRARERGFEGRVLIVTAGLSDADAAQVMSRGAAGIFLKHSSPSLLAKSIRTVMEGEVWLDQKYLTALLRMRVSRDEEEGKPRLTDRERTVLRGVLQGLGNKEIAERLSVSEGTVKATLQQLFNKTGVRNRSQLVRVALQEFQDQL
ncbi:MAG: response regulator transcription factor [Acidobacteria bacterium]|nr:response regulator transcription factor [Acidobacteriota bacterium]